MDAASTQGVVTSLSRACVPPPPFALKHPKHPKHPAVGVDDDNGRKGGGGDGEGERQRRWNEWCRVIMRHFDRLAKHLDAYICQAEPDTKGSLHIVEARRELLLLLDALGRDRTEELLLALLHKYRDPWSIVESEGSTTEDAIRVDERTRACRQQRATWATAHLCVLAARASSPFFLERSCGYLLLRDPWLQALARSQEDDPCIARTWNWVLRHALYVTQ